MGTADTLMAEALLRMATVAILMREAPIQVGKARIEMGTVAIPGCDASL